MLVPQPSPKPEMLALHHESTSEKAERQKHFLIYLAIFLGSLIALTAGVLIEEHLLLLLPNVFHIEPKTLDTLNKLAAHFFNEVGIAGLIACGLAFTIERFSTKEFAKHAQKLAAEEREAIKQDVFHAIFGHFVPKEIIGEMTSQILVETFLRKNFTIVYTLQPFLDIVTHSMFVHVDFKMKYDIINLSKHPRPFLLKAGFSKPPLPSLSDQSKFISVSAVGCENPFTLQEKEIATHPQTGSHISLNYKEPLLVRPGEDNPTTVTIHSQTVKHFAGGSSYFSVEYPTADLQLTAEVHDRTLEVYSGATPVCQGIEWLKKTPDYKSEDGYYDWYLQRPLLAFQSVYLTWNPKDLINAQLLPVESGDPNLGTES
ncbi:MAG: hypothetical protein AABN95_04540 [Acidobacteriota bacterium]